MSSLINLLISFLMGIFFGQEMIQSETAQSDPQIEQVEVFKELQVKQHILNS